MNVTVANPESGAAEVLPDVDSTAQALKARREAGRSNQSGDPPEVPEASMDQDAETVEKVVDTDVEESENQDAEPEVSDEPVGYTDWSLAEALELSLDEFGDGFKTKVKINGEESEVTLSELRSGYQRDADYRQKTMALSEERRGFEAAKAQQEQAMGQAFQQAAATLQGAQQMLYEEYQGTDWNDLRITDPGEYAAKQAEFQAKQQRVNTGMQQLMYQQQRAQAQQQQQVAEHTQQYLREQEALLLSRVPEWKDSAAFQAGKDELTRYLSEQGFTREQINGFSAANAVMLAKKAMEYDKGRTKAQDLRKKAKPALTSLKPGAARSRAARQADTTQKLRQNLHKSGHVRDAAALIRQKRQSRQKAKR